MVDRYPCIECRKDVSKTKNDRYRTHTTGDGEPCEMSSGEIPKHILDQGPVDSRRPSDVPVEGADYAQCPQCTRKVPLTRLGYFEPHDETLRGGDRCAVSGVRYEHARRTADVPLPGDALGASPVPKVKDSSTPAANRGLVPAPSPVSTGSSDTTVTVGEGSEIDWSKVGDLKHLTRSPDLDVHRDDRFHRPLDPDLREKLFARYAPDAGSGASTEISSPESTTTSTPLPLDTSPPELPGSISSDALASPEGPAAAEVFSLGVTLSPIFRQPSSPFLQPEAWVEPKPEFLQPPGYSGPAKAEPMSDLAKELAIQVKETFYAYSNRKTKDNRSAQTTLGPSEIGTPCDRRLAMSLMGIPAVNPGGDGWAAFVGTWTHQGMAEVYTFADAGTGRYAVELPVFLGMPSVPRGTTDLLDRRPGTVIDWKVMGAYSLKKFKQEGPSATYRTQAHVYGLGAERAGERVRHVAVVGLPRAGRSLDEMHVWTEKFDKKFAQAALDRVEKIANRVSVRQSSAPLTDMETAAEFPTGDDCLYCPFHLKNDKEMLRGCPGADK